MRTREGGREQFCVGREDEREMVRGTLEANSFQNLVDSILNCLLFLHIEFTSFMGNVTDYPCKCK